MTIQTHEHKVRKKSDDDGKDDEEEEEKVGNRRCDQKHT